MEGCFILFEIDSEIKLESLNLELVDNSIVCIFEEISICSFMLELESEINCELYLIIFSDVFIFVSVNSELSVNSLVSMSEEISACFSILELDSEANCEL